MKRLPQEQVYERYAQLPPAVKDAIFAEATADKMLEIATKHGLLINATGALAELTGYVMVGLLHPNDFVAELASELSVSKEKANVIAEDINQHIFKPIREHLMTMHKITEETAAPTPLKKTFVPSSPAVASAKEGSPPAATAPTQKPSFAAPMIFPKRIENEPPKPITLDPHNELAAPEIRPPLEVKPPPTPEQKPQDIKGPAFRPPTYDVADPYREPVE